MFDLNPIDVLKQRKLNYLPFHFSKIKISEIEVLDGLEEWVKAKLKGRYCLVKHPYSEEGSNLKSGTYIGFEDQKEVTYFILACPFLRRN